MDNVSNEKDIKVFFGGTFDPPHFGHLLPLQETADTLKLSSVSLLVANIPAFKKGITKAKHRIQMTKMLSELDDRFCIDLTEFERDDVSYTIDTLTQLKRRAPSQVILFVIGLDSLLSIDLWERWKQLFNYCHVVVMRRPKASNQDLSPASFQHKTNMASNLYNFYTSTNEFDAIVGSEMDDKTRLFLISKLALAENDFQCINHCAFKDIISNSATGNLWFVKNQALPLSSTVIRQQLQAGKNIRNWVPESIYDYINEHQLYIK